MRSLITHIMLICAALAVCDLAHAQGGQMYYSRDAESVYVRGVELEGADPSTFQDLGSYYGKDNSNVFRKGKLLEGADATTFELIDVDADAGHEEAGRYARDAMRVYYDGKALTNVHTKSFRVVGGAFAADKDHVFCAGGMAQDVDAATFTVLGDVINLWGTLMPTYQKDTNHVYYLGTKIEGADPVTFEPVRGKLSKDESHVFVESQIVEGCDPNTVAAVDGNYFRDKDCIFKGRRRVNTAYDMDTFEVIQSPYTKDANRVYYHDRVIEGADPETFQVLEGVYSKDKDHYYEDGRRSTNKPRRRRY